MVGDVVESLAHEPSVRVKQSGLSTPHCYIRDHRTLRTATVPRTYLASEVTR